MGMVLEGLFAVGIVVVLLWLWSVRSSLVKDRAEAQRQAMQDTQAQERIEREAQLYREGIPLRCLGCEARFVGPLGEHGCPCCHMATLVVTEDEWERGRQNAADRRAEGDMADGNTSSASG